MRWPKVTEDDDGIRPAGPPDECFYCHQKVGQEHGRKCVQVTKRARLEYTILVDVDVPHHWTPGNIEFHRNYSTWCANNAAGDIEAAAEELEKDGRCLCDDFKARFVEVVDAEPRRRERGE